MADKPPVKLGASGGPINLTGLKKLAHHVGEHRHLREVRGERGHVSGLCVALAEVAALILRGERLQA